MPNSTPEITIDHWQDLYQLLDELHAICPDENPLSWIDTNRTGKQELIFRGQRDPDWGLASTLEREICAQNLNLSSDDYQNLCKDLLDRYKRLFRGRISEQYILLDARYDDEIWAFGQHYGLKTPLLDWTHSIFVALYFAFIAQENAKNRYRAIFVLNQWSFAFPSLGIQCIQPSLDIGGRLNAQKGLFTKNQSKDFEQIDQKYQEVMDSICPNVQIDDKLAEKIASMQNIEPKDEAKYQAIYSVPLTKILIAESLRVDILNFLQKVNIDGFTLFPDTAGLIEQCHLELENMIGMLKNREYET